jgi:DNA-binding transcriptional MerR regulator
LVSNSQDEPSFNLQEIKRLIDEQEVANQQSSQALTQIRSRLEALEKSLSEREKVE